MTTLDFDKLRAIAAESRYPLLFSTISGAHLYGFPSFDSDVDIRGVHQLPLREVIGLRTGPDTLDRMWTADGVEYDLVTHDLGKFCSLLLGRNGNVLEMLLSPLVVTTSSVHAELIELAPGCLTKHHAHHYRGFAMTEWKLFGKSGGLKPLLYTFRTLLTGIHAMRTGRIEADLPSLIEEVKEAPAYLRMLIGAKQSGELIAAPQIDGLAEDVTALQAALDEAQAQTLLPERPTASDALNDLVVRNRLAASSVE